MNGVDLHTHSTASDGMLSPPALVARAAGLGITYLALTDHDSVDGIPAAIDAARPYPGLTMIPGVELSTDIENGEIHILGYFVDFTNLAFRVELERLRSSRQKRAHRMVERLHYLGFDLDWERIREIAGNGAIGRPHIARAMLEKGYTESFEEAFERYIGQGCPAYVERDKFTPPEAVNLVIEAGGIPVLAHPYSTSDPEAVIPALVATGLAGIEAYYYDHTTEQTDKLLNLAEQLGLIVTGGSDFHGLPASGGELGSVDVPLDAVRHLILLGTERHS
jgi:predicted metal-dependent phosphoesterase TrpH